MSPENPNAQSAPAALSLAGCIRKLAMIAFALLGGLAFGQQPLVNAVVNAASDDDRLCPGVLAIVRGLNYGSIPASVSVTIGGKAAFIEFSAPETLLIQVPVDLVTGGTSLIVTVGTLKSQPFALTLANFAPAIYSINGSTPFYGARGAISRFNPAAPGDLLYAFAIGLGATDPPATTGISFGGESAPTRTRVTLSVGGRNAAVDYAGLASGYAPGLYIVTFRVPTATPNGDQPVILTIGGASGPFLPLPTAFGLAGVTAVANSASFGTKGLVAGEIVSIFASSLGPDDVIGGFPSTRLNSVSVSINGTLAPIMNVLGSIGRVDIVVPNELAESGTAMVQIRNSLGTGFPFSVPLLAADVGIFIVADPSKASRRNAAVRFANSAWLVVPESMATALQLPSSCAGKSVAAACGQPATAGDLLEVYYTGGGRAIPNGDVNGPVLPTGSLTPPSGNPLYQTLATPAVTIGGMTAEVLFSGLTPGSAGLYQLNVRVPEGIQPGDDVVMTISMLGSTANATIAVR